MTDVGLQPVEGQDDATLLAQQGSQPLGVGRGQRPEFVVTVQEVGDRALRDDQAAAGQLLVDLGDAAVLGMSEPSDRGHDIEAELVIGQGEVGLGLGPVRETEPGTIGIVAASDGQSQPEDAVERRDGAEVVVAGPERVLTFRAVACDGYQAEGAIGFGARSSSLAHGGPPLVATSLLRNWPQLSLPAQFFSSLIPCVVRRASSAEPRRPTDNRQRRSDQRTIRAPKTTLPIRVLYVRPNRTRNR